MVQVDSVSVCVSGHRDLKYIIYHLDAGDLGSIRGLSSEVKRNVPLSTANARYEATYLWMQVTMCHVLPVLRVVSAISLD